MENDRPVNPSPFLLQPASSQVWIQAIGRLLYQAGYGSIQFYIPLIFVNQVGLSATVVGIGVGSGSLAGLVGHLLGGYLADSPLYGRKRALLFSAVLSILAAIVLVLTQNLPLLLIANLIMGLSAGCYWTAADTSVIDVTPPEQRQKAFAVLGLADSIGGGLGVWGGGLLLSLVDQAQSLFLVSSLILLIFLILVQVAIAETQQEKVTQPNTLQGFVVALNDRSLQLFVLVNVLFTTFIALANSILPLYFTNLPVAKSSLSESLLSESSLINVANLFTWCYIGFGAVLQFPIVQILSSLLRVRVLMISMLLWGVGFLLVWATALAGSMSIIWIIASLSVLSMATVIYRPFAPTIVAELAPESLRGIYLAISYQCWSIGYFVGPIVGGWAIDQSAAIAHHFWLVAASVTLLGLAILYVLSLDVLSHNQTIDRAAVDQSVVDKLTLDAEDPASIS